MKIIEIRKQISTLLKLANPRVYYQAASATAIFPYLVYDLGNSNDDGTLEQFFLDVDGWDDKADTTALETLMHNLDLQLHRKTITIGRFAFTFYRENRLTLVDDDPRLRRRKYIYQVQTYEGGI